MEIIIIYVFFTWLVYLSWLWDFFKESLGIKIMNILFALTCGWFVTPLLIGRAIAQIYKDK